MTEEPRPASTTRGLLWITAVSLAIIAFCLVVLVFRMSLREPYSGRQATAPPTTPSDDDQNQPVFRERLARVVKRPTSSDSAPAANGGSTSVPDAPQPTEQPPVATPVIVGGSYVAPAASSTASNADLGTIIGQVKLSGSAPPEKPIDLSGQSYCAKVQDQLLMTRNFVVGTNHGLADVLIYVVASGQKLPATSPATNELVFTHCQIEPYVSAISTGQFLRFRNADDTAHIGRIFSGKGLAIETLSANGAVSRPISFNGAQLFVPVRCGVHSWEQAYVSLLDTPLFAVTDSEGAFSISNVPPGSYWLTAVHHDALGTNSLNKPVSVNAGNATVMNLLIQAPRR